MAQSTDCIRGKQGYTEGLHLIGDSRNIIYVHSAYINMYHMIYAYLQSSRGPQNNEGPTQWLALQLRRLLFIRQVGSSCDHLVKVYLIIMWVHLIIVLINGCDHNIDCQPGYQSLVGTTADSWGWDLGRGKVWKISFSIMKIILNFKNYSQLYYYSQL